MNKDNSKIIIIIISIVIILAICLFIGIIFNKNDNEATENNEIVEDKISESNTNRLYDGTVEIGTPLEFTINEVKIPKKVGSEQRYESENNTWYYNLDSEGNAINIYAYGKFTGDVILPNELDGHKVISIGKNLEGTKNTLFYTSINGENYWNNITSIIVPDGVKYINSYAFYGYENLRNVTLPDSIIYIGDNAFSASKNLSSINSDIEGKVVMPKNLQYYGKALFKDNNKINAFEFPEQIDYIQNYTFSNTTGFSDLVIVGQFKYIGEGAFNSSEIKTLTIESGVKIIEKSAFSINKLLNKIDMADSVVDIGTEAFKLCTSLTEFNYNGKLTHIGKEVFDYTKVKECLKSSQLPNS